MLVEFEKKVRRREGLYTIVRFLFIYLFFFCFTKCYVILSYRIVDVVGNTELIFFFIRFRQTRKSESIKFLSVSLYISISHKLNVDLIFFLNHEATTSQARDKAINE